jgi:hypothetical protein
MLYDPPATLVRRESSSNNKTRSLGLRYLAESEQTDRYVVEGRR